MSAPAMSTMPECSVVRPRSNVIFDLLVAISSPRRQISPALLDQIDCHELLRQAEHHSLLPLLAHRLLQSSYGSLLPKDLRDHLRHEFQSNLRHSFGLLEEAKRILQTWRELGIEAMPYKGPALAEQLWGSFALRQCSDLDFLLRREDVDRAAQVLAEMGYRAEMPTPTWLGPALLRDASELQFRHSKSTLLLELQWAPAPRTLAVRYDENQLWRNRTTSTVAGMNVTAPSPEDLLGLLVIHGWKHNWSKLIWVADLATLIDRSQLDWDYIHQSAHKNCWRRILSLGLGMVRRIYELETAPVEGDSPIAALADHLKNNLQNAIDASYVEWHRDMLRARDSRRHQARQLANFIFTPGLAEYTSFEFPSWAVPAYRLIRVQRVISMLSAKAAE